MKIIKPIPLTFLLLLTFAYANAQRGGWSDTSPEDKAKQQTEMMAEKLSFSEKQAEKVGEINLKYAKKMKEAFADNQDGDRSAIRETMMEMRKEQNADLKSVMTSGQFEQWEKIQAEQRNRRRGQRGQQKDGPDKKEKGGNE